MQELDVSRGVEMYLNQAEMFMAMLSTVLENAPFCFHSALPVRNN